VSVTDPIPAPAPRNSTATVVIAIVVVIAAFLSGVAAGVLLTHLHMMRAGIGGGRMVERMMVHRLERSLDLTHDQRTKVEEIIARHHRRINALTDAVRPQVHDEIEAANREIEAVLTPEQRAKFAKLKLRLGHREGRVRMAPTR
jgi:Spy/CpxP family protein refolding chaperone